MNSRLIKATASTIVLGASLTACTPSASLFRPTSASANATQGDRLAVKAHEGAQKAMLKGDLFTAISGMEQAVELSPQDVGYRKTLAELYLKTGRFASAEATYADVVKLNPGDSKAAFFVTICQLAQGRTTAALRELDMMGGSVDAADLGLAYALAGNVRRAIRLLEPAARDVSATARVRQNLALAYALAGDWKNARSVAQQDVTPGDLNKRLQQWAALASLDAPEARVAMMFGVSPASDPGQPSRLALVPVAAPAEASAVTAAAEAQPAAVATPEPVQVAAAVQAEPVAATVPAATVVAAPAPAPGFTAPSEPVKRAALPVAQAKVRKAAGSRFVVQIGSYNAPDQVERGYAQLLGRHALIGKFEPVSTSVHIDGRGKFHRLSLAGFESRDAAAKACSAIKAQGGACFVRETAGDAPVQWASRYSRKA